ncbi:BamA/TamA family outer membrane protein [Chitinophaga costaii]|nr:BamA/TamA family outer membrane protein [Chitinophaga costaii]
MKWMLCLWLLLGSSVVAKAQQDSAQAPVTDSLRGHYHSFFPIPVLGYSPEKGLEFGAAMLYSFYADKKHPSPVTRNSSLNLVPAFTTKHQYKIDLRADVWTRNNTWHVRGGMRYQYFPFSFYGLGDSTHASDRSLVDNRRFRAQVDGERRLTGHFYAGISLAYQYDEYKSSNDKGIYSSMPLNYKEGGHELFAGVTAVYDDRDNQNYTTRGTFLRLNVANALAFASTQTVYTIDLRGNQFFSISKKSIIGLNGYFRSVQGDNVPFFLLPELGSDQMMRGYYTGRYRDRNYLTAQVEYRYLVDPKIHIKIGRLNTHPKFALAAFAGAGDVFGNHHFDLGDFKPSLGGGIRYFYDEHAKLTVRIDGAIGEKRPGESRQKGLYLSLAEAF